MMDLLQNENDNFITLGLNKLNFNLLININK